MSSLTTNLPAANFGQSLSNVVAGVNQYVVAPIGAFGLAGFVFNAIGDATANLSADITDHYAEDNTAIQDQIAIRPTRVILKGYVGEVIYTAPGGGQSALNSLTQKLGALSSFLPTLASSATQIQELVDNPGTASFSSLLGTASNIYGLVKNTLQASGPTQNQQNAYLYFKALMQSATLMAIQTPWEFMTNMAIENITVIQSEKSQWISDFSVTLKQIRIASTKTLGPLSNTSSLTSIVPASLQSTIAAVQQAVKTQLGSLTGSPDTSVFTNSVFGPLL